MESSKREFYVAPPRKSVAVVTALAVAVAVPTTPILSGNAVYTASAQTAVPLPDGVSNVGVIQDGKDWKADVFFHKPMTLDTVTVEFVPPSSSNPRDSASAGDSVLSRIPEQRSYRFDHVRNGKVVSTVDVPGYRTLSASSTERNAIKIAFILPQGTKIEANDKISFVAPGEGSNFPTPYRSGVSGSRFTRVGLNEDPDPAGSQSSTTSVTSTAPTVTVTPTLTVTNTPTVTAKATELVETIVSTITPTSTVIEVPTVTAPTTTITRTASALTETPTSIERSTPTVTARATTTTQPVRTVVVTPSTTTFTTPTTTEARVTVTAPTRTETVRAAAYTTTEVATAAPTTVTRTVVTRPTVTSRPTVTPTVTVDGTPKTIIASTRTVTPTVTVQTEVVETAPVTRTVRPNAPTSTAPGAATMLGQNRNLPVSQPAASAPSALQGALSPSSAEVHARPEERAMSQPNGEFMKGQPRMADRFPFEYQTGASVAAGNTTVLKLTSDESLPAGTTFALRDITEFGGWIATVDKSTGAIMVTAPTSGGGALEIPVVAYFPDGSTREFATTVAVKDPQELAVIRPDTEQPQTDEASSRGTWIALVASALTALAVVGGAAWMNRTEIRHTLAQFGLEF